MLVLAIEFYKKLKLYQHIIHRHSQAKQRQYADIRLKYIMAHAKQKFLSMLCEEDILLGKAPVENFGRFFLREHLDFLTTLMYSFIASV